MAAITSRSGLKEYCLRRLGKPVIEINIDEQQCEDRLDEAIDYFRQYHFDGSEKVYTTHTITQTDIDNEYITAGDPIQSVIRVLPQSSLYSACFANEKYQLVLNDLDTFTGTSMINYAMKMSHFEMLDNLLSNEYTFMFNKTQNRLYIEEKWSEEFNVGDKLVMECYRVLDPETYTEIYDSVFIKKYTTALFKKQWGNNLKKFEGVVLPGGMTLNGQNIYQEAIDELQRIEEEMNFTWELPPDGLIG